jgi:hypothetical protein
MLALYSAKGAHAGPFADVPPGHWACRAIECLFEWAIIEGHPDAPFKGRGTVTYCDGVVATAQIVRKLERRLGRSLPTPPPISGFSDVPRDHWAAASLDWLATRGVLRGYPSAEPAPQLAPYLAEALTKLCNKGILPNGIRLNPQESISRMQAAEWLARALGHGLRYESKQKEWKLWREDGAEIRLADILTGDPGGELRLRDPVTRYEFVVMVWRMVNHLYPEMKCP